MINIAICDDDKKAITQLKRHLDEYESDKCIITACICSEDLLRIGRASTLYSLIFDIGLQNVKMILENHL